MTGRGRRTSRRRIDFGRGECCRDRWKRRDCRFERRFSGLVPEEASSSDLCLICNLSNRWQPSNCNFLGIIGGQGVVGSMGNCGKFSNATGLPCPSADGKNVAGLKYWYVLSNVRGREKGERDIGERGAGSIKRESRRDSDGMVGVRIGEASNPGPDRDGLEVLTVNVTSWGVQEDWVLAREEEVILVQETRLTKEGLRAAIKRARRAGWKMVGEEGYPGSSGAIGGGVAILWKEKLKGRQLRSGVGEMHQGRFCTCEVQVGEQIIPVGCVYGYVGGGSECRDANDNLVGGIFREFRERGGGNWVVGGDWNQELAELDVEPWIRNRFWFVPRGFTDFATVRGKSRRIDYFLLGMMWRSGVTEEKPIEDEHVATHVPVSIRLAITGKPSKQRQLIAPKAGNKDKICGSEVEKAWGRLGEGINEVWRKGPGEPTLEGWWLLWCELAEDLLRAVDPDMGKGRGRDKSFEWKGEEQCHRTQGVKVSKEVMELRRRTRRAEEWARIVKSGKTGVKVNEIRGKIIGDLQRRATGEGAEISEFDMDKNGEECEKYAKRLGEELQTAVNKTRTGRWKAWVDWQKESAEKNKGRLYAWVRNGESKGDWHLEIDGSSCYDETTMAEKVAGEWNGLWKGTKVAGDRKGRSRKSEDIGGGSGSDWRKLKGEDLWNVAKRVHGGTAGGPDGWKAHEIKALPLGIWKMAAEFCAKAEALGRWPDTLRGATVVMIPKEGASSPSDMRPIAILPLFYRIWAAARRPEVKEWEKGEGHREFDVLGRSALEAAWEMARDAELAEAEGKAMAAVLLDCSKCYERIPPGKLEKQVCARGFPARLARMAVDIYEGPRWVRVGQAYAEPVFATRGIMPGCGLAVALLKAFFMEAVEERPAGVKACKYVDDIKMWVAGEHNEVAEAVIGAYEKVKSKLEECEAVVNVGKTGFVASTEQAREGIRARRQEGDPEVWSGAKDLGVWVSWGGGKKNVVRRCVTKDAARVGHASMASKGNCTLGGGKVPPSFALALMAPVVMVPLAGEGEGGCASSAWHIDHRPVTRPRASTVRELGARGAVVEG